jgi:hypothetical protein
MIPLRKLRQGGLVAAESGSEKRRFPRLREACAIRVRPIAGASLPGDGVEAMTVNISGGGLCYRSATRVEAGEFLAVELTLPEFTSPVVAMGRAVYCEEQAAGFDVGVEFWWVGWGDDSAQRAIADYIKTELRQREAPRS